MTGISSFARVPSLLSPRTASYIAALIREGDTFDYSKWLREVRANEITARRTSDGLVYRQLDNRGDVPEHRAVWPTSRPDTIRTTPVRIALSRSRHDTREETPEARLTRRLEKIREAWSHFQSSRARDAVYKYLAHVFAIVEHYKVRHRTRKLLQRAFEFADLPFCKNADPFTAIIRCTSDDCVESKMISKWARALRYVARSKKPETGLKAFMKRAGGINACADLYASMQQTTRPVSRGPSAKIV